MVQERTSFLARKQLCVNCGKPNHTAEVCRIQTPHINQESVFKHESNREPRRPRWQQAAQTHPQPIQNPGIPRHSTVRRQTHTLMDASQNVITFKEEGSQQNKSDSKDEGLVCQISGTKDHKRVLLLIGNALIKEPTGSK